MYKIIIIIIIIIMIMATAAANDSNDKTFPKHFKSQKSMLTHPLKHIFVFNVAKNGDDVVELLLKLGV